MLYQTFRDLDYSDATIRAWITQPAHHNWQLMRNMCCFDGPISHALLDKRAASARQIIAHLRELGITPVLPGFFGLVPADFSQHFPGAHVVPQGEWAGFTRPGWLDPRDPMFARLPDSLDRALRTGVPAEPMDWFAVGDNWNHGTQPYAITSSGDTYAIAQRIDRTAVHAGHNI